MDCYKSIINQTYKNWEVIIFDDGSTDNSVAVITEVIANDTRFKLFVGNKNRGCGYAKHKCCGYASGDVLGFLDPDDAIKPQAIKLMVDAHGSFKEASIITSNYEMVDLNLKMIKKGANASKIPNDKSYLTYGKGAFTHFASFKKEAYSRTVGIDTTMKRAVDQDLYYKLEEQGQHVFINKYLYLYRIHENSISANHNLFKAQYWHFYAMKAAHKRRLKNKSLLDNFTKSYMQEYESNYYLGRFEKSKLDKTFKTKSYFLWKSIAANPFHKLTRKMKSMVLLLIGRI